MVSASGLPRRRQRLFSALLFPALLFSAVAEAQLFADEAARNQAKTNADEIKNITLILRDLSDSVQALEQAREQLITLTRKNQTMEQQLRLLGGRIEELERQVINTLQAQETNERVRHTAQKKNLADEKDKLTAATADIADLRRQLNDILALISLPPEDELYARAYADYQNNALNKAIEAFQRVLFYYPQGAFSANCRYWLAQIYLAQQNYAAAQENAETLLASSPQSDLTPATLLVLAQALEGLGQTEEANARLRELITTYPTSLAADAARQRLQ